MSSNNLSKCPVCLNDSLNVGDKLVVNNTEQIVVLYGFSVYLTKTEMDIFYALWTRTFKKRSDLWSIVNNSNYDKEVNERAVDSHIKRIRSRLSPLGVEIKAVYEEGYELNISPVTEKQVQENLRLSETEKNSVENAVLNTQADVGRISHSEDIGEMPRFEWIPLDKVIVDSNYQRGLNIRHARKIAQEFEWKNFQPPTLAERPDGTFVVLDGQHRFHAAKLHPNIDSVPVYIVQATNLAIEADIFIDTNTIRLKVTAVDLFWAGITAEKPEYVKLSQVLNRVGVQIVDRIGNKGSNKISSVKKLLMVIQNYGENILEQTLQILKNAFPEHKDSFKASYIHAVAELIQSGVEPASIKNVLHTYNPETLEAKCRDMQQGFKTRSTPETLVELVNRTLQNKYE